MELQDRLLEIERSLWTNDAVVYESSLTDNALLVFPETGAISRSIAVEAIRLENADGRRWAEVRFSDVQARWISADAALLTYRVAARWAHERSAVAALATSVYVRRDDAWKLAFHQQSPLDRRDAEGGRGRAGIQQSRRAPVSIPAGTVGAGSAGAVAFGALAVGATAIGALAIGRLAVGAFTLKRGRVRALGVDQLRIGRLHVGELRVDRESGGSR
jgi:hypothetical protein